MKLIQVVYVDVNNEAFAANALELGWDSAVELFEEMEAEDLLLDGAVLVADTDEADEDVSKAESLGQLLVHYVHGDVSGNRWYTFEMNGYRFPDGRVFVDDADGWI